MSVEATLPGGATSLALTRILDAPPEAVFSAWTDPERLSLWWGPKDFTNPVCELDVRPGGALSIVMRGPDGAQYPCRGTFREIVKPERLVFTTTAFEDDAGRPQLEELNTVAIEAFGGKTKLTLRAELVRTTRAVEGPLSGMEQGWGESLDRLGEMFPLHR